MMHHRPISPLVLVLVVVCGVCEISAARIYFEKCNIKGFECKKSIKFPGKYDIIYGCNALNGWDIDFNLWQFRAPSSITSLKLENCTSVRLNLQCTSEPTRHIQTFHIANVTKLILVPLVHGLSQSATEMIFENIQHLQTIPVRTFIQIKQFQYAKYGCTTPTQKDLESIVFRNVQIDDDIERDAFYQLVNMANVTFENVTVNRINAMAIQINLAKNVEMKITASKIGLMEYLALQIRGSKLVLMSNSIKELYSDAINATVFDFDYLNNTAGWLHCASFNILAQNVRILDNTFDYIATGAFQAIGPGLPENPQYGFGNLKFNYQFRNNLVESLEVASLHPDWRAYKNVGSIIVVSYNAIKCTCAELAWLASVEGFGRDFSTLNEFHSIVLKKENHNICVDAPCILPVGVAVMYLMKDGKCQKNIITQDIICENYYHSTTTTTTIATTTTTTTTTTTKKSLNKLLVHQQQNSTPPLRFQQLGLSFKSNSSNNSQKQSQHIFITVFTILYILIKTFGGNLIPN